MKAKLNVMNAGKDITMTVTLTNRRQFHFRFWLGTKLIIMAAHIMGMGIKIKTDGNPEKMERPKPWPDPPGGFNG